MRTERIVITGKKLNDKVRATKITRYVSPQILNSKEWAPSAFKVYSGQIEFS